MLTNSRTFVACGRSLGSYGISISQNHVRGLAQMRKKGPKSASSAIVRNEDIKAKEMRVVYTDPDTNEGAWKIMNRKDALSFAKKLEMDLILVNGDTDPAVCKIQDYGKLVMDKSVKRKEQKAAAKSRSLKEMFVKGGIDTNDLNTKVRKIKEFLEAGHTVKVVVLAKKDILRRNPYAIDETTLKIVELVEDYVNTIKQGRASSAFRSDFLLSPKPAGKK